MIKIQKQEKKCANGTSAIMEWEMGNAVVLVKKTGIATACS